MNPILIFYDSIKREVTATFMPSSGMIGLNGKSVWKFCSSILDDFVAFLVPSKRIGGSFQAELLIGKQFCKLIDGCAFVFLQGFIDHGKISILKFNILRS